MIASSAYAANSQLKADDQAINASCTSEAQTAGCTGDAAGKGLLKCLHAYKQANPGFKYSPACRSAIKQRHLDKQAQLNAASGSAATPATAAPTASSGTTR